MNVVRLVYPNSTNPTYVNQHRTKLALHDALPMCHQVNYCNTPLLKSGLLLVAIRPDVDAPDMSRLQHYVGG